MLQLRVLPHILWREMMGRSSSSCHQVPWLHTSVSTGWMLHSDDGRVPSPCKGDACSPTWGTNPAHFGEYFAAATLLSSPSSLLPLFLAVTDVTLYIETPRHTCSWARVLSCWCLVFPLLCTAQRRVVLICCIHLTSSPHSHSSGHWPPHPQGICSWWVTVMSEFTPDVSSLVLLLFIGITNLYEKLPSNPDFPLISLTAGAQSPLLVQPLPILLFPVILILSVII